MVGLLSDFFFVICACSGYTMFEEEEAVWATSWAAGQLPTSHSWPGKDLFIYFKVYLINALSVMAPVRVVTTTKPDTMTRCMGLRSEVIILCTDSAQVL